eukprot:jgi/Botrbrau1/21807/Bobra.0190s0027.1
MNASLRHKEYAIRGKDHEIIKDWTGQFVIERLESLCFKPLAKLVLMQSSVQDIEDIVGSLNSFEEALRLLKELQSMVQPLNEATSSNWAMALQAYARCFPLKSLCATIAAARPGNVLGRLAPCYSQLQHLELFVPSLSTLGWVQGLEQLVCLGLHGCEGLPGGQLKHLNCLSKLRALELSRCAALETGLEEDFEALAGLPPLVSLSLVDSNVGDRFMKHVLKRHLCDHYGSPGALPGTQQCGGDGDRPAKRPRQSFSFKAGARFSTDGSSGCSTKPTLRVVILRGTGITSLTVDMLSDSVASPVFVDLRVPPTQVGEADVAAFAAKWKLTRIRPRVLAQSAAVASSVERQRFATSVYKAERQKSDVKHPTMGGCICKVQETNFGRDLMARWVGGRAAGFRLPAEASGPDQPGMGAFKGEAAHPRGRLRARRIRCSAVEPGGQPKPGWRRFECSAVGAGALRSGASPA